MTDAHRSDDEVLARGELQGGSTGVPGSTVVLRSDLDGPLLSAWSRENPLAEDGELGPLSIPQVDTLREMVGDQ